ncbi:MAG TPA: TM0106 family RecB-like putative nuclease [Candidatus Acidoferrum sp.]|nr:TM0106 family RecB-like putative nuclease [Candidatus Acidoferrum sp.]
MKLAFEQIRLSATDLSNHLACRHVTTLDLQVVRGEKRAPDWAAPDLVVIRERGERHEAAYLAYLAQQKKLQVVNLSEIKDERELLEKTRRLMEEGAEVIAQGALTEGYWFGRPDVLRRVSKRGPKWDWSYEVVDTKLARETKAGTILQISMYSELLEKAQECAPERMWVIPPGEDFAGEAYRVAEYAAYFRYVKDRLARAAQNGGGSGTYPEPVAHCDVCRWFRECDTQRRGEDHLSLVAGIRRQQRNQLEEWDTETMAKLAVLPVPLQERPKHGSREAIERVREQGRVQVTGRSEKRLVHEPLLPVADGMGLCRLPEPSANDVFVDLEGDPFVEQSGLQYMFGFAFKNAGDEWSYEKRWALNCEEEKKGFEWLVDEIMRRREANPKMHVYHFGAYEPGTLKRLMGMYATREDQIDRLLRAGVLVDLHQAFKQSTLASVEEYSLKKIEAFYRFERKTPLDVSRAAMRYVEHRLELGWGDEELPKSIREAMEGYNSEDCFSAAKLRDWLEARREELVERGVSVPRPPEKTGDPSEKLQEKLDRAAALTQRLSEGIPANAKAWSEEQSAQWLLAQLLSWHRREDKRAWQEGYRFAEMEDEELLDERVGLTRMRFVERVDAGRQVPTDRYMFDQQKSNVRVGKSVYFWDDRFGEVVAIDHAQGIADIKKMKRTADVHPPTVYMWDAPLNTDAQAGSLYRIGDWVASKEVDAHGPYRAGRDLLLRRPPRLLNGEKLKPLASEKPENTASRIALALDDSVFAIQGPPGSGKTYTGARMICELVKRGKKIGVTALSHKVIRNLLEAVVEAGREKGVDGVRCMHRQPGGEESDGVAVAKKDNEEAWDALHSRRTNVLGGVSWLWSPEPAFESVDVLFIDEAGQMALADVIAVSQAAKNMVLLGDPQQLERPLKGSHPGGAEKSALEHLLNGRKTIPEDMGFLLPESWRLHPEVCKFTSEVFYEGKLSSHAIARSRVLEGHAWLERPGLWFVPVEHEGNRNSCAEEVEVAARIVEGLLKPKVKWFYGAGNSRRLKEEDILIVAPYNAQVADLSVRLPKMRIGTVDKFQGQEAPVVIYSLTTSSPEEAPRGMEFLYSLNRLNVATSRAMSNVIVVGSPKLLEPDCRTPRQMQLANALCRYRELAKIVELPKP